MDNTEFDKWMIEKYPKIFRDRHGNMQETAMCWGFEIGEGWHNLVACLCSQIQHHIDWSRQNRANALKYNRALKRAINGDTKGLELWHSIDGVLSEWGQRRIEDDIERQEFRDIPNKVTQVIATQVKEKFGELRFYYRGGDEYIRGLETMASAMSVVICETCGNKGKRTGTGWIRTTCEEHSK